MTRYESGTATVAVPDSYESWTGRIWDHHSATSIDDYRNSPDTSTHTAAEEEPVTYINIIE